MSKRRQNIMSGHVLKCIYVLKACDACADMGQLQCSVPISSYALFLASRSSGICSPSYTLNCANSTSFTARNIFKLSNLSLVMVCLFCKHYVALPSKLVCQLCVTNYENHY